MLIVFRHSQRQDQVYNPEIVWKEKYTRPYDPPISDLNLPSEVIRNDLEPSLSKQKELMKVFKPEKVVTSPFLRCVQTAALIGKYYNIDTYEVDNRIAEDIVAIDKYIQRSNTKLEKILNGEDAGKTEDKKEVILPSQVTLKNYLDISLLERNAIKDIISDLTKMEHDKIKITWTHQKFPVDEVEAPKLVLDCVKEYRDYVSNHGNTVIMVTHAKPMSDISLYFKSIPCNPKYCGWFVVTCNNVFDVRSSEYLIARSVFQKKKKKITDSSLFCTTWKPMVTI
ncbi:hypothetical protein RFI_29518 [Reticulomyxa filosa]|uniref:Phosphoglycerate mutase family protein n=1 Tax=Reticulomyxa filosa TaxID=46433 RepID=X6M4D5_RETFI|nr:hypothetical protein RFI_29518 [Reticulomyxa filosa]|eukprot:ETO07870.1 hypothetical protein RFI_29518 [Reticulomyxa filosa]